MALVELCYPLVLIFMGNMVGSDERNDCLASSLSDYCFESHNCDVHLQRVMNCLLLMNKRQLALPLVE